ncbi:MAG: YeeE/YedE family protein [Phycisphaerales bacterium]|nr:YeeE/YedE family protein [Phycisphaerales bacterium]
MTERWRARPLHLLLLTILSLIPALSGQGNVVPMERHEVFVARAAREMLQRDDWVVPYFNGEPRVNKPPLSYWAVIAADRINGGDARVTPTESRAPSIVAGVTAVICIYFIGGLLFGGGWAIMGYCPGTSVGAIAEGRWHALFAVLGMLLGAALYAEAFPALSNTVLAWKDFGKISLPEVLGLSHWIVIPLFIAGTIGMFAWFEKKHL